MSEFDELLKKFEEPATKPQVEPKKPTILVIDDDDSIRRGLTRTLSSKYVIKTAKNGLEGINKLDCAFHCIILDVKMKNMNGFDTYPRLKEKCPGVPIIFFTAFQSEHDLQSVINKYKPEGYVEKGRDLSFLEHLIRNAVEKYKLYLENEEYKKDLEKKVEERTKKLIETQKELIHKNTMAAVSYLTIGMAHNLRNSLKAIKLLMDQLAETANKFFLDSRTLNIFNILSEDQDQLRKFLILKYSGNKEIKDIDTGVASKIGKELKAHLSGLDPAIKLTTRYQRNLAKYNITPKDLDTIYPYLKKYSLKTIQELLDFSYKLCASRCGSNKMMAEANDIINSTMTLAELENREDTETDLNQGIEDVLSRYDEDFLEQQVVVKKEYDPNLPRIHMDVRIIDQIFYNLVSNSLYALRSLADNADNRVISIKTYADEKNVIVKFSDTGEGIHEENHSKIFQPFFTTKPEGEGKGLGLYVVYQMMSIYGSIDIKSKFRETTFILKIKKGEDFPKGI